MLLPAIQTWQEWGAMFTDVAQWKAAVDEICRQHGIRYRRIQAGYPGTNAVFVLDRSTVVKIYAPFCHEDFDLERVLYPLLSGHDGIPSPQLIAQGILEDAIRWPYIVMDFKPGLPLREVREQIPHDNLIAIAAALGEMIRALHEIPLAQLDNLGGLLGNWEAFVQARQTGCIADLREKTGLAQPVLDEISAFLAAQAQTSGRPVRLVNGDLTEDHILLQRRRGRWHISGLIDFADALIAPREYEWVALWFSALDCQGDAFRACMRGYEAAGWGLSTRPAEPRITFDQSFFDTAMAFTLLHEFAAGIIDWTLRRWGYPPVPSFQALHDLLWRSRLG